MNIFYVHKDPVKSAKMLIDKHVVKMIIESAQMLSTAHRLIDGEQWEDRTKAGRRIKRWRLKNKEHEDIIYKASHVKHPSTIWVMASAYNYYWLYNQMVALNDEFKLRYNKDHKSYTLLKDLLKNPPKNIPLNIPFNQPTQAMPDDVKNEDSITAYRDYYIKYKRSFATWKTTTPTWFTEGINANIHI